MPEKQEASGKLTTIPEIWSDQLCAFLDYVEAMAGEDEAASLEQIILHQHECLEQGLYTLMMEDEADSMSIDGLLWWARTPEGSEYWSDVHDKVGEFYFR